MSGALDKDFLAACEAEVMGSERYRLAINAVTSAGHVDALTDRNVAASLNVLGGCGVVPTFSNRIETEGNPRVKSDQKVLAVCAPQCRTYSDDGKVRSRV